jgi:hypothetical protein
MIWKATTKIEIDLEICGSRWRALGLRAADKLLSHNKRWTMP